MRKCALRRSAWRGLIGGDASGVVGAVCNRTGADLGSRMLAASRANWSPVSFTTLNFHTGPHGYVPRDPDTIAASPAASARTSQAKSVGDRLQSSC